MLGTGRIFKSCVLLLIDLGKPFKIVVFEDNDYKLLIDQCNRDVKHLIIDYSWYPEILAAIKEERHGFNYTLEHIMLRPCNTFIVQSYQSFRIIGIFDLYMVLLDFPGETFNVVSSQIHSLE